MCALPTRHAGVPGSLPAQQRLYHKSQLWELWQHLRKGPSLPGSSAWATWPVVMPAASVSSTLGTWSFAGVGLPASVANFSCPPGPRAQQPALCICSARRCIQLAQTCKMGGALCCPVANGIPTHPKCVPATALANAPTVCAVSPRPAVRGSTATQTRTSITVVLASPTVYGGSSEFSSIPCCSCRCFLPPCDLTQYSPVWQSQMRCCLTHSVSCLSPLHLCSRGTPVSRRPG